MADITVRPARPEDLRRAGQVAVAAYCRPGQGWLRPEDPYCAELADAATRAREAELLVALDADGRLIGTVTLCRAGNPWAEICGPGEVEFRILAVDPAAEGRGAGTALVNAVIQRARELGARRVVLCSVEIMHAAQRIYRRMGFVRLPERDWATEGVRLLAYGLDLT